MQVSIERIGPDQGDILRDVRLRALREAPYAFGTRYEDAVDEPEQEWTASARASARGSSRAYFLAFNDAPARNDGVERHAVGMVQGRRRPPDDCLLFSMWVAPEARASGVGRGLVQAVSDWGAGFGARRVVLWVTQANDGARRFYDRIGFRILEDGPDAEAGAAFQALAMERPIGAAR